MCVLTVLLNRVGLLCPPVRTSIKPVEFYAVYYTYDDEDIVIIKLYKNSFFDEECRCWDQNAICNGAVPPSTKGRCQCKQEWHAMPDAVGALRCQTGAIGMPCYSNSQCELIKTTDAQGNAIPSIAWDDRFRASCSHQVEPTASHVITTQQSLASGTSNVILSQNGAGGQSQVTSGGVPIVGSTGFVSHDSMCAIAKISK